MAVMTYVGRSLAGYVSRLPVRPPAVAAFAIILAYRGGLWLQYMHQVAGATEVHEPAPLVHWLRDATLMLPLTSLAVIAALLLMHHLLTGAGGACSGPSPFLAGILIVVAVALCTSVAEAATSPLHNALFRATEAVHAHGHARPGIWPALPHVVRDGLAALAANLVITGAVFLLLGGQVFRQTPHGGGTVDNVEARTSAAGSI